MRSTCHCCKFRNFELVIKERQTFYNFIEGKGLNYQLKTIFIG